MFVVSRDSLYKTLSQLNRAIDKDSYAEFGFIHIATVEADHTLVVQAKNDIWSLQMAVPDVTVIKAVDVLVPAKYLLQALKKMPEKLPVTMTYDDDTQLLRIEWRMVKGDNERLLDMTVECKPGSEWSGMYTPVDGSIQLEFPYSMLATEYPKVIDCAALVDNRPVLTGIYVGLKAHDAQTTELTMACGDGYRLAVKTSLIPQVSHEFDFVFYADMWREWVKLHDSRLKKDKTGFFKVDVPIMRQNDKTIEYGSFRSDDGSLVMSWQYLKGQFPAFDHIIPSTQAFTLTTSSADLRAAVDTCLIYGAEDAHRIRLDSSRTMRQLVVTGSKPGGAAKITDKIPAVVTLDPAAPDDFHVCIDGRFVLDTLDAMTGDVTLSSQLPTHNSPWVFTPVLDNSYLIVVMPMSKDK